LGAPCDLRVRHPRTWLIARATTPSEDSGRFVSNPSAMSFSPRSTRLLLVVILAMGPGFMASVPTQASVASDVVLAKAVVAVDGEVTPQLLSELTDLGVQQGFSLPSIQAVAVTAPIEVLQRLSQHPQVRAVQPQRRIRVALNESVEQIGGREALESARYRLGRGGRTFERPAVTGSGVTVAVIDSGVFSQHPDLAGKVTAGLNFELSSLSQGSFGIIPAEEWDLYAQGTGFLALQDEVGHGTHVASTIGGTGAGSLDPTVDLRGVAPDANFVSMKLASAVNGVVEDFGFEENALAALDYLVRHPELGISVANNSWTLLPYEPSSLGDLGFPADYDAAAELTHKIVDSGITMVFAAGNTGIDPEGGSEIAIAPNGQEDVITVAAACKEDAALGSDEGCVAGRLIGDFSSRGAADGTGPQVDVSAPGDNILAAASPSMLVPLSRCVDRVVEQPLYECLSGTSMAAPHVAGVVALMQQVNPDLTPAQAEQCLVATADDMVDEANGLTLGFDIHSGFGLVDVPSALICAHQLTDPPPLKGRAF
jgi:serine protease AprX